MTTINDTLDVTRRVGARSSGAFGMQRGKKARASIHSQIGVLSAFPARLRHCDQQRALEWREVSGKGVVFSYIIARRARAPFAGHEPFFIVLATFDEGVNVMANMGSCSQEETRIGLRVKPYWAPPLNGTHLLMFESNR